VSARCDEYNIKHNHPSLLKNYTKELIMRRTANEITGRIAWT